MIVMTHPENGPAIFVADAPALDFLNSVASPGGTEIDWISDGAGWINWLKQTGWVDLAILHNIEVKAMPGELDMVASQAQALRAWFREFVIKYRGKPLVAEALSDLATLNHLLERDDKYSSIVPDPVEPLRFQYRQLRRWPTPQALLLPVGELLADFVCSEDFTNIKSCEGVGCTLMFIDHTRGKKRRWCSMAVCGNRAKAAAHRERSKVSGS